MADTLSTNDIEEEEEEEETTMLLAHTIHSTIVYHHCRSRSVVSCCCPVNVVGALLMAYWLCREAVIGHHLVAMMFWCVCCVYAKLRRLC